MKAASARLCPNTAHPLPKHSTGRTAAAPFERTSCGFKSQNVCPGLPSECVMPESDSPNQSSQTDTSVITSMLKTTSDQLGEKGCVLCAIRWPSYIYCYVNAREMRGTFFGGVWAACCSRTVRMLATAALTPSSFRMSGCIC